MILIKIPTASHDQIVDITGEVENELRQMVAQDGVCHVFVKHTTCALTLADLDPGTDLDLLDFLRKVQPELAYRHAHDPKHAPDHIWSSLIGVSVMIPVKGGEMQLGTWQRIVLVELSGPREREVVLSFLRT